MNSKQIVEMALAKAKAAKAHALDAEAETEETAKEPNRQAPAEGQPSAEAEAEPKADGQDAPQNAQKPPQESEQPNAGEEPKIDQNDVVEAVKAFLAKPYWEKLYNEAPEGAKTRLALNFYFTKSKDKPTFSREAYLSLREALEKNLNHEDLVYLVQNMNNDAAKNHFRDLLMKLPGGEGETNGEAPQAENQEAQADEPAGEPKAESEQPANATEATTPEKPDAEK